MTPILLEVCVESVASAAAAERGGAHRIELCSNLAVEGVTPNRKLMEKVRRRISLPLHVLIRPRPGDFLYASAEFELMKNDIEQAKRLGVNGVVFGILNRANQIDVARTRDLTEIARPLAVTFHRAFDVCADLSSALEAVVETGADRILTSGGARDADEGSPMLARLVKQASGQLTILASGSIRETNVRRIVEATGVHEVHASLLPRSADSRNQAETLRPESVARLLQAASPIRKTYG
jgi:copper homeostasis protein